jgi:hypothetical protein
MDNELIQQMLYVRQWLRIHFASSGEANPRPCV